MGLTQAGTDGIKDDAISLAKMAAGTDGQIITYDASGNPTAVGPGTDGQVLTSTGAGSPPAFEDAGGGLDGVTTGSGNVTITDGNLIVASGHGVDFSATADGPQVSHASELFDDYEEGTWNVTFNGNVAGNTGQDKAQYVKIGRVCHIAGQVHLDSSGNTDNVEVNNLPFASAHSHGEGSGQQQVLGGSYELNHNSDTVGVRFYIGDNTQTAKLIDMRDNAGYTQVAAVPSKYVIMSMTYITE